MGSLSVSASVMRSCAQAGTPLPAHRQQRVVHAFQPGTKISAKIWLELMCPRWSFTVTTIALFLFQWQDSEPPRSSKGLGWLWSKEAHTASEIQDLKDQLSKEKL